MGEPLAIAIARAGAEVSPGDLRKRDVEAGIPLPLRGAAPAFHIRSLDHRGAEARRAGHSAVAAFDAAIGDHGPAGVVQLKLEPLADAGHRKRLSHLRPHRLHVVHGGARFSVARAARRQLGHDRRAFGRAGMHDEAFVDLGHQDVVPAADFGTRAHRGAEARARGGGALDGDDERGRPAGAEILVGELATEEDAILDAQGGDLAGADTQERQLWSVGCGLLEAERPGSMGSGDRQIGWEGEPLPRGRADRVAEDPLVRPGLEAVTSGRLFVPPTSRQLRCRLDLVIDDRAFSDSRADDAPTGAAQAIDERAEVRAGQEPLPGRGRLAWDRSGCHGRSDLLRRRLACGLELANDSTAAEPTLSGRIDREAAAASGGAVGRRPGELEGRG